MFVIKKRGRMLKQDELKADVRLKWYADGRMEFSLPRDPMLAYALLHCALDELQERMMLVKQEHQTKRELVMMPNNGRQPEEKWGE